MRCLQAVKWADDTVDNEDMGKKSSKSAATRTGRLAGDCHSPCLPLRL